MKSDQISLKDAAVFEHLKRVLTAYVSCPIPDNKYKFLEAIRVCTELLQRPNLSELQTQFEF